MLNNSKGMLKKNYDNPIVNKQLAIEFFVHVSIKNCIELDFEYKILI